MGTPARKILILIAPLLSSGCASHIVRTAEPNPVGNGGEAFRHQQTSVFGRSGLSSAGTGYVTKTECRTGELDSVEVRRNFGQGVITLLTLGTVSPATILFYCTAPLIPPPGDSDAQDQD